MVYSTSKLTATLGLNDTVVVETQDAVLICDKNNLNGVENIYTKLNGKNLEKKEIHKTVYRPWGYYTVLENGSGFLTKCITVNPNAKLSVQLHHHRSEHWIILEGEATVLKGETFLNLKAGESVDINIEEIHSLQNLAQVQLKVLEIQQGDILDENDIERIEDIYGRV
jgi:mannose-6-phosphate isomerase-like protein (cupin superfamily)